MGAIRLLVLDAAFKFSFLQLPNSLGEKLVFTVLVARQPGQLKRVFKGAALISVFWKVLFQKCHPHPRFTHITYISHTYHIHIT